jgi:hypothetical protein
LLPLKNDVPVKNKMMNLK